MQKFVVVISKDGKVETEASGFSDASCLKEAEELEKALGTVTKRELKAEGSVPAKAGAGTVKAVK